MGGVKSKDWYNTMRDFKKRQSPYGGMSDGVYNSTPSRELPTDRIVTLPDDYVSKNKHKQLPKSDLFPVLDKLNLSNDFCLGNVVKYVSRSRGRNKDKEKEDLRKALIYLQRKIETL